MSDNIDDPKPVGVLQSTDLDGRVVNSSKRLMGTVLIIAGGLLLVALGIVSMFREISDPSTGLESGKALIWTGAALLGVGVLDGIGQALGRGK